MPDDSAGNNSLTPGYLAVTGQTVLASQHNPPLEDISASLTRRYMRDGRAPMLGNVQMNGYRATGAANAQDDQDYVTLAQIQSLLAALATVPPGVMEAYTISSSTAPVGWIFASGQTLLRATYPALWAVVSSGGNLAASEGVKTVGQYGPGDGSTTFTVPNLHSGTTDGGYFVRAFAVGRPIGGAQVDDIKSHAHTATFSGVAVPPHSHSYISAPGGAGNDFGGGSQAITSGSTGSAGGFTPAGSVNVAATGAAETRPKNISYPYIIKT